MAHHFKNSTMNQYRQTAAELHNLRSPIPETSTERILGIALAVVIGIGIGCLLVAWWSA